MMATQGKETVLVIFFILVISPHTVEAKGGECSSSTACGNGGPVIRFPFRLRSQPQLCGYPGFELTCQDNHTLLHLPSYPRDLYVTEINYRNGSLSIDGPDGCLVRLILDRPLDTSSSPFVSFGGIDTYTIFNCSSPSQDLSSQNHSLLCPLSCLNSPGYYVYALPLLADVADIVKMSCEKVTTAKLPYVGSDRLDFLYWSDALKCVVCEQQGRRCRFKGGNRYRFKGGNPSEDDLECYSNVGPTRGSSTGAFVIIVAAIMTIKVYHIWKKNLRMDRENQLKIEKFLENYKSLKPMRYTYADIKRVTDNFKRKLGQGGYGSVYKGELPNGNSVAVKVLEQFKGIGEEFINEVATIGKIHHINIVSLLGFCAEGFKRVLVYEFMPKGSLEKFIFSVDDKSTLLGWEKLQKIAIGIARGIEYLHQGCNHRILHFDIKPHNILLDNNFNPKISDFGLAKSYSKEESIVSMTAARGTVGYIAPEVFSRNFGKVSYKSDVYSFGMLLLEMVGGRKNIDTTVENTSQVYFPEWIYNRLIQGDELGIRIEVKSDVEIARKLTIVGLWCIQWHPVDRPSMKNVLQMLEGDIGSLNLPPNPFASNCPQPPKIPVTYPKNSHQTSLTIISVVG